MLADPVLWEGPFLLAFKNKCFAELLREVGFFPVLAAFHFLLGATK